MRDRRRGGGMVESLVALLLTTGLLILIGGLLVRVQGSARTLGERVEGAEAARLTRDLLSLALASDPAVRLEGADLRVRTFVGVGERCGESTWRYRGRRLPDPERDSLWIVTDVGRVRVAALAAAAPGACPAAPGARDVELEADPPLTSRAQLVRVFESGRYRVDDALRYGRSGAGAQPLSAPVLDPGRSGFARGAGVRVFATPRGRREGYTGLWRP